MNRAETAVRNWAHRKGVARRVNEGGRPGNRDVLVETRWPIPQLAVWASQFRFEDGDIDVRIEAALGLRRKYRVTCKRRERTW